jgi:hypothetical protein
VERALLGHFRDDLLAPEALAEFSREYSRVVLERQASGGAKRTRLNARLKKWEQKITTLLDAIESGIITPSTKAKLLEVEAAKERLTAEEIESLS